MSSFFYANQPVFDLILLGSGMAFSQWIVLRAGVFSVAGPGFAGLGAYAAAIMTVDYGIHPIFGMIVALLVGTAFGYLLSLPLARLRGVYQAIATLAFVQIVVSVNLYAEDITRGALGIDSIPKVVGTFELALAAGVVIYLMAAMNTSRIGRAFEAIREDEAVASSLGMSVIFYHRLAFTISGAIAGFYGSLVAFHDYHIEPTEFGFGFLIAALSYVILGGRRSVSGPIVGAVILVTLPEFSREFGEFRNLGYGVILMLVIAYLPKGVVDTALDSLKHKRLRRQQKGAQQ